MNVVCPIPFLGCLWGPEDELGILQSFPVILVLETSRFSGVQTRQSHNIDRFTDLQKMVDLNKSVFPNVFWVKMLVIQLCFGDRNPWKLQ